MSLLRRRPVVCVLAVVLLLLSRSSQSADHNDPNAINSIFSDVPRNGADLYDLFGYPTQSTSGGERVLVALTFAAMPDTGVLDPDLLYRVLFSAAGRVAPPAAEERSLKAVLDYFDAVRDKYLTVKPYELRVRVDRSNRAKVDFLDFPGGAISQTIDTNKTATLKAPDGSDIKVFVGGRDDAFFNDLPGFFRSINYAPQFYKVPQAMTDARELPIPKTLLELDGNVLFNFDPQKPTHGQGLKLELPPGPHGWSGKGYKKDANGNYRFVYSGKDAQAGMNVNAVIVELPLGYITKSPQTDRIVNTWAESWVLKASGKIAQIPEDGARLPGSRLLERGWLVGGLLIAIGLIAILYAVTAPRASRRKWWIEVPAAAVIAAGIALGVLHEIRPGQQAELARASMGDELRQYKLVDTDGQPFADAGLNERDDAKQVGAFNVVLG